MDIFNMKDDIELINIEAKLIAKKGSVGIETKIFSDGIIGEFLKERELETGKKVITEEMLKSFEKFQRDLLENVSFLVEDYFKNKTDTESNITDTIIKRIVEEELGKILKGGGKDGKE